MSWGGSRVRRLASEVIATHGAVCWLCGQPIDLRLPRTEPGGLSVDHVLPRSKGGTDDLTNLRPAHHHCNSSRQDRPASSVRPRRRTVIASGWPGLST